MRQFVQFMRNMVVLALLVPLLSHAAPTVDDTVSNRTRVSRSSYSQMTKLSVRDHSDQQHIDTIMMNSHGHHLSDHHIKNVDGKYIRINKMLETSIQSVSVQYPDAMSYRFRVTDDAKPKIIYSARLKVPI